MHAVPRRGAHRLSLLLMVLSLLTAAVLLWVGVNVLARASGLVVSGPVYSVAAVRAELAEQSAAWAGRIVLLRGQVYGCSFNGHTPSPCTGWQPSIGDSAAPAALPLWVGGTDPLMAFLRRLPLVRNLIPPPQVLYFDAPATYRVRLRALDDTQCGGAVCYEAVLLDAQIP